MVIREIFSSLLPAAWILAYAFGKNYTTDPHLTEEIKAAYKRVAILWGVGIIVAVITILGALTYSVWLVLLGAVYLTVENVLSTYYTYPVIKDAISAPAFYIALPVIVTLLSLYPHIVFMREVNMGVLRRSVTEFQPILV